MSDEHVKEGLEHIQNAAIELIGALRSFLDAAEDLVRDPTEAMNAVTLFTQAAAAVRPDRDDDDGVTHVRVS